jgi:serine/threonine protein kinase
MDLSREARIADLQQRLASLPRDSWIAELSTKCPDDAAMRAEVLERLGHRDESSDPALVSQFVPFTGTARFVVRRQLGSGAFGTVYEAWDRDQQVAVALKLLHSDNPETLFRFKREFRALVDVRHANLVQLFELVSEGTLWFFTMELVKGRDFFRYVRPDAVSCQVDRLRHVLGQLAEGLRALHAAQRLHRDLKPANALVTDAGRLVLLDFGLVRELDRPTSHDTHSQIAGTPAYMAPELFREGRVSEASDWYALGVMLFEALTGNLPHDRSPLRFRSEPAASALDPRSMNPHAPPDLSELCVGLLSNRPEERRHAAATIPAAPANAPGAAGDPSIRRVADVEHFVGRSTQLHQIDAAFADTQEGRLNVVLVNGPSGIGKTTLVKRFLSSLEQRQPDAIVLRGRCYEFESVPYKGVDSLVDELSRHLQRLPDARVEALLPRDASLLPKLFPVLGRVTAIATAPMRSAIVPDARELRQRTFRALREVFERLSDRHPMVVWIDDLQWGDRDSSTFLAELCAPPQQPALLLLLSYRNEDLMSNPTLSYLHQVIANRGFPGNWHELSIAALNPEESRRLLTELLPPQIDAAPEARAKIIEEAGGHPLFLQQLASVTSTRFSELTGAAGDGKTLELRQVLQDRVQHLPALAREILEFLCLAAQGLSTPVLFAAAENEDVTERADTLALLIRERLARSASVDAERRIEPAHDQVRAAVVAMLPEHTRRARHARLAHVLAAQPDIEPQVLVTHYQEAGDHEAAFDASLKAASLAESQLASIGRRFSTRWHSTHEERPVREAELYRKLAHTLGLAGRGRDSAHAFLRAADCAAALDPFDLKRMAADQLMRSGFIDEGLELFDQLAQAIGVPRVRGPAAAVRGIVLSRIRTRLRLLTGPPQPAPTPVDSLELERLELLHTGGVILNIADPVLATFFQTQHILKALRVREPVHLAIALGVEPASVSRAAATRKPHWRCTRVRGSSPKRPATPTRSDSCICCARIWTTCCAAFPKASATASRRSNFSASAAPAWRGRSRPGTCCASGSSAGPATSKTSASCCRGCSRRARLAVT